MKEDGELGRFEIEITLAHDNTRSRTIFFLERIVIPQIEAQFPNSCSFLGASPGSARDYSLLRNFVGRLKQSATVNGEERRWETIGDDKKDVKKTIIPSKE